jgi:hypothetical protein
MIPQGFIAIPERGLITISGRDRFTFIQGLITNDIRLLSNQKSLYSCLLTPNGKFLYDFFITENEDALLLETEGGYRALGLLERLQKFKLRADVFFEVREQQTVYACLSQEKKDTYSYPDPRHPLMGIRSLYKPGELAEIPFSFWDEHRIKCAIPNGSLDMTPEKSMPLDFNLDKLSGMSFEKGCYMGQELSARMKYRGLSKKSLYVLSFKGVPPAPHSDLRDDTGSIIGEMLSSSGSFGLALLKKSNLSFSSGEYEIYLQPKD